MATERRRIEIAGLVQGVGFRPFVYRLADSFQLKGWVANYSGGLRIEVQGKSREIEKFIDKLSSEKPPYSRITHIESYPVALQAEYGFRILPSVRDASSSTIVLPDLAPCDDCLRELSDPNNRRYDYPFISCTLCGPRYSIIYKLPYDRVNTSMHHFPLCGKCSGEYRDPLNRRFHAEPNACPQCGPQLLFCNTAGVTIAKKSRALSKALDALAQGKIIALKGVGGFQLLADASNGKALANLRQRKQRPHKPFALLYDELKSVCQDCCVSEQEAQLLSTRERPIVLLEAKDDSHSRIHPLVAPNLADLGVMLPASPLHYLLAQKYRAPLVATSGNLAEEPICTENDEAFERLGKIADYFLVHNRRILRPLDDSVLRVVNNRPLMLRRARGYAPLPITLPSPSQKGESERESFLALGADLKNTVALSHAGWAYPSQHIGDLGSANTLKHFNQTIGDLTKLQQCRPKKLIHDLHPGYTSHRWAMKQRAVRIGVQHHIAHLFSCMAEHAHSGPALGICWDGTGYDRSGIVRGGEFFHWNGQSPVKHIASFRTFPLPGGEKAVREPRRSAAGLLYEISGFVALENRQLKRCFTRGERQNLVTMLKGEINSPPCSSVGRLFDAVSALLGLTTHTSFEGQAAMALEQCARGVSSKDSYPFSLVQKGDLLELDWTPCISALIYDENRSLPQRAAAFHNTLAQMALAVATQQGEKNIFLSGGVFQNKRLTETVTALLESQGFSVHSHSEVPPNDGGISLGQIHYAQCMDAAGQSLGEESS
ncbi:carbamoyltransferase HypF [Microbulbifer sp. PAAF003]|uniref:carbamoyltransferase HypF n=1 Tax=Microbulbifer sp. PAAF003 TaxID=3243375 RepID=UPI00403A208B